MEDAPETISVFPNSEIAVLRNGKAKKNDPPIPADLAPISGSGKRAHQEDPQDDPVRLEPIRFRYSTEKVVDDPADAPEEASEESRRNRNRRRKPRDNQKSDVPTREPQSKKEKPESAPKNIPAKEAEAPSESESSDTGKKPPRRRNNYRRYRKPKSGGDTQH